MKKIGIFGGTFDPVHVGHLILAERCREDAGLDEVRFVPSARPPHKDSRAITPFERRCEMLRLAVAGHPAFVVDELEDEREGPSYTADTLEQLRRSEPDAELFLIVGGDCLPDLPGWHEPMRIIDAASLLAVARPGAMIWEPSRLADSLGCNVGRVRIERADSPLIDVSSTEVRRLVGEGRGIRYLVPRAVEEYIRDKELYRG